MSINIKVSLEQVWSINDRGFLQVDVVPLGLANKPIGTFLLDDDTIIASLEEDIEEAELHQADFNPIDWVNLKNSLRDIADQIEDILEGDDDVA